MTNRMTSPPDARKVIVGVDTHKHVHVAVAIDTWGIRLGDQSFVADSGGYQALITWAETHGRLEAFGIEGTGSYGAGLARAVRRAGHRVVEVNRGDRRTRRAAGKSDTIDAEVAARSVLAGQSTAIPKTADGAVRDDAPAQDHAGYRGEGAHHGDEHAEADHRARPARTARKPFTTSPITACSRAAPDSDRVPSTRPPHQPSTPSGRWPDAGSPSPMKSRPTTVTSRDSRPRRHPPSAEGFGVGAHTAAELLIIFGDNPDRIRSEAAFAKLCGACPIPASSGMTTGRHRLNRGGHRQANAALYRAVIVRMRFHQPTVDYVARRTAGGRDQTRDHPVPQTLPRPRDLPAGHDRLSSAPSRHPGRLNDLS